MTGFIQLFRNATMGSMREARYAGTYPATSATAANKPAMPAKVTGSVGAVPNSSDAIILATAIDPTKPTAIPASASLSVLPSTPASTCP